MRLFLALPIPQSMGDQLAHALRPRKGDGVTWVKPRQYHVTLLFLGEVGQQKISELGAYLSDIAVKQKKFSLVFDRIDYGPPNKPRPEMIWAYFRANPDFLSLANFARQALRMLIEPVWEQDQKQMLPHATLARLKGGVDGQYFVEPPPIDPLPVRSLELLHSTLSAVGPKYQVIQEFSFGS